MASTVPSAHPDPASVSRNIVLGVTGGIAAYKACHVVRGFTERGHSVRVVPTESALNFVGAATFEALSGNPVAVSVFDRVEEVQHVRVGQNADLVVIAPATADLMAKLAIGRADDLLTATCLVATCPVVLAPAMHTEMWNHPATRANVEILRSRGVTVLEPAHGRLTGPDTGPGRLPEPQQIIDLALLRLAENELPRDLNGRRILITAGGTRENIDPVRYLGNRSSGRQGFALAEVAVQRGAKVTLVAGSVDELPVPCGAELVRVSSARELDEEVRTRADVHDVIIMAAAVADYRPTDVAPVKLKKTGATALTNLELTENPDILAGLVADRLAGKLREDTVIVGFAAETGDDAATALDHAVQKIRRKGCDLLMCNDVGSGKVFGRSRNRGWLITPDGVATDVPDGTKFEVASRILDFVSRITSGR
ncbi:MULTISPECIES: bifunctional phosphopantothenoylcysteine decarboxylase/phosphopantothenate--cysteine ligase CoaBC [unclassified Corynebacterium]|uniref:bifunctional phosphopantothenoylcysteine decarboxylase/phosphopantothenate--cysteine ligase CoaBC n=1 Tax=unclassified Corynebacterium TaxID=2624378 RepID=UPI0035256DA7